jgi:1A family penicillin-binding protein
MKNLDRGAVRQHWPSLLLLLALLSSLGGWALWDRFALSLSDVLEQRSSSPTTRIYDRHGQLLYEIIDPHAGKHTPLPLAEIPLVLQQATIATEDASFYTNPGVDLRAILRALWINVRGGEVLAGGSTITQQLARNLLLSPQERTQRTLVRKLRESVLAWSLARRYSKDEILASYLNEIYYGNFAYGVEAAAQAYFGKSAAELDLAEAALIAGLPQAPSAYNPLVDPQAAQARQAVVLDLMARSAYITPQQAVLAGTEPLHFAASAFPIRAPHFVMYVRELLEKEYGLGMLYRGGLRVYTTLDLGWQEVAQSVVQRHLAHLADRRDGPNPHLSDAALLGLDPRTGEILVMLGSPDYFEAAIDGAVNVTLMPRQPGSAIKPLTYAAALDPARDCPHTPATLIADVRTAFLTAEGQPYVPVNYDLIYHGPVLARRALACSYNLPAVKVLEEVGVDQMAALARQLGITTFTDMERFGLALTLGGGEVRLLELTAAYAAFANRGRQVTPVAITRVEDSRGQVLRRWVPEPGRQVLDPRVAYLITDILSDEWARMPAFGEGSVLHLSRPAAAKTGTTTDWRDNWTVGYTPELAVGVWAGNADNSPMQQVSGVTGAGPMWHDFMETVLAGRPVREFEEPEGMVRVEICSLSGVRPNSTCPHRRQEIFIAGTEPAHVCDMHQAMDPGVGSAPQVSALLSPELADSGTGAGWPEAPPESRGPAPGAGSAAEPLAVTSPDPNSVYRLDPVQPAESQRIALAARSSGGMAFERVVLRVDGEALAELTAPPYRTLWPLQRGEHLVTAVGYRANGETWESGPVRIRVE